MSTVSLFLGLASIFLDFNFFYKFCWSVFSGFKYFSKFCWGIFLNFARKKAGAGFLGSRFLPTMHIVYSLYFQLYAINYGQKLVYKKIPCILPRKAENISNTICRQVSDLAQLSDVLNFNGSLTPTIQFMGSHPRMSSSNEHL